MLLGSFCALVDASTPAKWKRARGGGEDNYATIEAAHHKQQEDVDNLFARPEEDENCYRILYCPPGGMTSHHYDGGSNTGGAKSAVRKMPPPTQT